MNNADDITNAINECFKDEIKATYLDSSQEETRHIMIMHILLVRQNSFISLEFHGGELIHVDGSIFVFEINKINEWLERIKR